MRPEAAAGPAVRLVSCYRDVFAAPAAAQPASSFAAGAVSLKETPGYSRHSSRAESAELFQVVQLCWPGYEPRAREAGLGVLSECSKSPGPGTGHGWEAK
jgi:hypothetical protein